MDLESELQVVKFKIYSPWSYLQNQTSTIYFKSWIALVAQRTTTHFYLKMFISPGLERLNHNPDGEEEVLEKKLQLPFFLGLSDLINFLYIEYKRSPSFLCVFVNTVQIASKTIVWCFKLNVVDAQRISKRYEVMLRMICKVFILPISSCVERDTSMPHRAATQIVCIFIVAVFNVSHWSTEFSSFYTKTSFAAFATS